MTLPNLGNRYQLQKRIGQGDMGDIYRALDLVTGSPVAVKRLPTGIPGPALAMCRQALTREFQLLKTLRHPNIIRALDYGVDTQGQPYLVTELVENAAEVTTAAHGQSLAARIDLFIQLLDALDYLHRRRIAHRDLKPANVLVTGQQVRVVDFGLSIRLNQATEPGGTLAYLPPELVAAVFETVDLSRIDYRKVDLYAAGVLFYQMVCARHPFSGNDPQQLINNILDQKPDLGQIGIFAPVAASLLEKQPDLRCGSARQAALNVLTIQQTASWAA